MIPQRQSGLGRGLGAIIPPKPQATPVVSLVIPSVDEGDVETGVLMMSTKESRPEVLAVSVSVSTSTPATTSGLQELSLDQIERNPYQPRTQFDHNELEELIKSIESHGMLQPLVVSPLGNERFQLIAGERRFRALGILGKTHVPVIVREATEQQKLEFAIIENVQRQDLNPLEEAKAYIRLSEEFGLTQEAIADRVGKSRPQISNTIRLLQLPKEIQDALLEKKISSSNARTLLSLPNDHERLKLFYAMIANNFTVREVEERATPKSMVGSTKDPNITDLEFKLRDQLHCRVEIKQNMKGAGEIRIKYTSQEELKRLSNVLQEGMGGTT